MPRRPEHSYEDLLAESVADSLLDGADAIAAEHGAPPDMDAPSEREKVRLWGRSDPAVDYDALVEALTTTGVPPEMMATMQVSRYAKSHPELVQAYAQPVQDRALAERLAAIAEYPFKLALYDQLDPRNRVKEAERLDRELAKQRGTTRTETEAPVQASASAETGGY